MAIYENGNNGIGSIRFDDNTILEVKQPGGGGSGVGGANGLNARNLVTGEDTGEVIAAQNEQIAEQGEEIDQLTEQNTELQAENVRLQDANAELTEIINNFPQIEALTVTANGTYSETGKAYSPVNVNVPGLAVLNKGTFKFNIVNTSSDDIIAAVLNVNENYGSTIVNPYLYHVAAGNSASTYAMAVKCAFESRVKISGKIVKTDGSIVVISAVTGTLPNGVTLNSGYYSSGEFIIDITKNADAANTTLTITI